MKHRLFKIKNKNNLIKNIRNNCRIFGISFLALFIAISALSLMFLVTPAEADDSPETPHIWITDGYIHGTGFLENYSIDIDIIIPDVFEHFGSTITDSDGNFVYEYDLSGIEGEGFVEASDGTNTAGTSYIGNYYSYWYEVESYGDPTYSVPKDDFAPGDIVFAKGVKTRGLNCHLKLEFYDPSDNLRHTCTTSTQTNTITCAYLLPDDAPLGQWTIKFYTKFSDYLSYRLKATDHFNAGTEGGEPTDENVIINLYYISSGDLTATFTGEAGGDVNYWIEDINVYGEFSNLWSVINNLGNKLASTQTTANTAFLIATSNDREIFEHRMELQKHNYTLRIHYNAINETFKRLNFLKNEIIIFEQHYFDFVNATNSTLNDQEDLINDLRAQINSVNALIRNSLIGIGGLGLLICAIYLINRRYPLRETFRNGRGMFKNGRQYEIGEFIQKTKTPREPNKTLSTLKYKIARVQRMQIKRNPARSPLQIITSIRRNPEKSILRSLFPFLFYNR